MQQYWVSVTENQQRDQAKAKAKHLLVWLDWPWMGHMRLPGDGLRWCLLCSVLSYQSWRWLSYQSWRWCTRYKARGAGRRNRTPGNRSIYLVGMLNPAAWQQADGHHGGGGRRGANVRHQRADLPASHPAAPHTRPQSSMPHSPLSLRAATGYRGAVRARECVDRLRQIEAGVCGNFSRGICITWSACSVAVRRGRCVKSIGPVRITTTLTASPGGNSPFCTRHNVFSDRSLRGGGWVRSEATPRRSVSRARLFTLNTESRLQETILLRR